MPTAAVLLVANNDRIVFNLFSLGERDRLDGGSLHLYVVERVLSCRDWEERSAERFEIEVDPAARLQAAIDGEPVALSSPLDVRIEPRALRLLEPGD